MRWGINSAVPRRQHKTSMAISADQWAFALLSIHMTWSPGTEPGGDGHRGWGLGQPEACNFVICEAVAAS